MKKILAIIILFFSFIGLTACSQKPTEEVIIDSTGQEEVIEANASYYNEQYSIKIMLGADGYLYTTAKDGNTNKKKYQQYDNMILVDEDSGYSSIYYLTDDGKTLIKVALTSNSNYNTTIYVKQ